MFTSRKSEKENCQDWCTRCKIREELRRFRIKLKLGKRHVKYDDEK